MRRIIKALILGWVGKKIYDRVSANDEPTKDAMAKDAPAKTVAHAKRTPKRTARKAARRAA